jgi:hypothetical protein
MSVKQVVSEGVTRGLFTRYTLKAASKLRLIPYSVQFDWGLVDRPHYAFGLAQSAAEARSLGFTSMTAIEFGVAGGNGLVTLERYANFVSQQTGVSIDVVGFDTGAGLPAPVDYRDAPHLWAPGDFAMDEELLRSRLERAHLVLGDVRETVKTFTAELDRRSPVGFVAFDLDLWSSTVSAFDVFRGDARACLPRVWCYFDDIVAMVEDVGELLAINEFNSQEQHRKIRHPWMLRANVPLRPTWADQMFQAHLFDHPDYTTLIAPPESRVLPLHGS